MTIQVDRLVAVAIVFGAVACGDPASDVTTIVEGDAAVAPGTPCAPLNLTRACACGSALGVQTCGGQGYGACVCSGGSAGEGGLAIDAGSLTVPADQTPPGNLRADIVFDWARAEASPGTCEAGNYEGQFTGLYLPQAAYAAPIPVFDLSNGDRPGLAFTLEQSENGEKLTIANGYVKGTADGLFPFDAKLTGTLDCKTATFTGELDGFYKIPFPFIEGPYSFKGPVTGKYDKNAHVFVSGTWNVTEYDPPPVAPLYGGSGDWNAHWLP